MNGLSHVVGASSPPLLDLTIGEMLDLAAARRPDAAALIVRHQQVRLTWSELRTRAETLASGLLDLGLVPGDRIGIWAPNCTEWTILQFAAAKAGLILVTINPAFRTSELLYALTKSGCAALVTAARFKSSDYVAMLNEALPELALSRPGGLAAAALPDLRLVITTDDVARPGCVPFHAVYRPVTRLPDVDPVDAVAIQFTSGTTGYPKGATLSHRNILNNACFVGARIGLTERDRLCIPVPLYHCFGMVMGNLACLVHGAAMVYPGESFDPAAVLSAVAEERCTGLYGVPTMFIAMLEHAAFADFDLTSLRTGIMAGSPCPIATMRKVIKRMGMSEVTIAYGMTETSPVSFQTDPGDPIEERVSSVGRIQPHLEAKVVGPDGETLPCGETGELCTRGYAVMLGYWDDPGHSAEAIDAAGWMHTGDLATIDETGCCRIVGRIKDMVIRGGENIYPREIEEFLMTHPAVADAQVIGVPDDTFGEELCAWLMLRAGHSLSEEALRAYCRGRIAHYKIPRHIRFVDAFPMTVTGKIRKVEMRAEMIRLMSS